MGVYDLTSDAYDGLMPSAAGKGLDDPGLGFTFEELGLKYNFIQPRRFGDPSLFLDFRATRRWIGRKFVKWSKIQTRTHRTHRTWCRC